MVGKARRLLGEHSTVERWRCKAMGCGCTARLRSATAMHGQQRYGTASQSSATAGQSTDTTITARRLSEARPEPRFAPRRHGQGTHRKGVAQSRKAAALLWTAWPGTATAKVREEMRCQGIARLSWRRRAPQRMSIAWLGWGRASCGSAVAEHQNAQRRPAMAKFSEASQRLSTTAHREGLAQQRLARRLQGLARNSTA